MEIHYRRINNCCGFFIFLVALTIYSLTIEPTASFWDCSEFITASYKLEIGHPPGAPFFMLTANFFTLFASDPSQVAALVNYMSACMSASTILFLFWSITHLAKRMWVNGGNKFGLSGIILIMGCGLTGGLIYTFSDSFWFSAVEGEVYAYSSLFTALVFWLILKWEERADEPRSDRWLVLIAYMTGLSIGVHLLNLLCLPAIALVYYFRKHPDAPLKRMVIPVMGSLVLVAVVLYGIVPGIVKVGGWFELLFVNKLGFSYRSGLFVYILILLLSFAWSILETYRNVSKQRIYLSFLIVVSLLGIPFWGYGVKSLMAGLGMLAVLTVCLFNSTVRTKLGITVRGLNLCLLCALLMVAGYSSYALVMIRSAANTPMDQNSPEDLFTLGDYLGREQYGSRPLLYGPAFTSQRAIREENGYCVYDYESGAAIYTRKNKKNPEEKDEYVQSGNRMQPVYAQNMWFPRMYHPEFAEEYRRWIEIKGREVSYDRCGELVRVSLPTQWENVRFFFRYQLDFMYWRYFLWNFVGRQNDLQGQGEIEHGNWITGFSLIDNYLIGDQDLYPGELKSNKGRNVYYGLPLLLGLAGIIFQFTRGKRGRESFFVVAFLFFMTGIAIIIYLNQTPMQVRERDYAYAGSFYAFSIWAGLGVAALHSLLNRFWRSDLTPVVSTVICILIPVQMASQTWDDHDRSDRFMCRDFGSNYLMTCPEKGNPVMFCSGDNETFPMWYNIEVEGVRRDVRVCNLSYLQTDWYIDQMKRPAYESPALPILLNRREYADGILDYVYIRPELKSQIDAYYQADPEKAAGEFGDNPYEWKNIMRYWIGSDNPQMRIIPTDSLVIKLDKEAIRRSGMKIPESFCKEIPGYMTLSLKGKQALTKSEIMMIQIVAGCNWERPVYIAATTGPDSQFCFTDYFSQEGMAYRITPFKTKRPDSRIDIESTYDNLMHKYKWGGIDKPDIYLDEKVMMMCYGYRRLFVGLARQLYSVGENERASEVLQYSQKVVPEVNVPYDYQNGALEMAEMYYLLQRKPEAEKIMEALASKSAQYIAWYLSLDENQFAVSQAACIYHMSLLNEELKQMNTFDSALQDHYAIKFDGFYRLLNQKRLN